jgi:hypothetical protein
MTEPGSQGDSLAALSTVDATLTLVASVEVQ